MKILIIQVLETQKNILFFFILIFLNYFDFYLNYFNIYLNYFNLLLKYLDYSNVKKNEWI